MLIWGLTNFTINALTAAVMSLSTQISKQSASLDSDKSNANLALATTMYTQRNVVAATSRIPGNIIQMLMGLYLCRRYHRLLNWLMKDIPTI